MTFDLVRAPRFQAPFLPTICVLVLGPQLLPALGLQRQSMNSLLGRAFAALRTWLGLNDSTDDRLYPAHGWLLPDPAVVRARLAPVMAMRGAAKVRFEGGR